MDFDHNIDHTAFIALTLAICALALAFGVLHLIAGISAMKKDFKPSRVVMPLGCVIALLAIPACLMGWPWNLDSLLMAIGGGAVCGAAYYNGKSAAAKAGDEKLFHLSHHLIRFGIVLILVFAFTRV